MADEEKETQEIQEQASGQPEKTSTETLYERTEAIVQRQKEENDRREALIAREEELFARKQLRGQANAGSGNPKTKEELLEETAKKEADEIANAFR
jgi:uncharacterized protein (DUF3084 family)